MKQIREKLGEITNQLNISNDFIILDVDRTIINSTSWYRACIEPDILIPGEKVEEFKRINDEAFKNPTPEVLEKFRKDTFDLISRKIDSHFVKKVEKDIKSYFKVGDYTNIWRFYSAGYYTALNLVGTYMDAIDYIKFASKYYGNNLKVIFLTAGYEPFIKGVVDAIVDKNNLDVNYSVIGSEVEFSKGVVTETFHMSQKEKARVVENIISLGGKIRFLADDSNEDTTLFDIVTKSGGVALNIKHVGKVEVNPSWREYRESLTDSYIKEKIKNEDSTIGLNKKEIVLPIVAQQIASITNDIGIACIERTEFEVGLNYLKNKVNIPKDSARLAEIITSFTFRNNGVVYLRGKMFYNWLPQFMFLDNRSLNERWKELITVSLEALNLVYKYDLISQVSTFEENVLIYCIIDNLIEATFFLLNMCEQNSLAGDKAYEKEHGKILRFTQSVVDLLYAFFYEDVNINEVLNDVLVKAKLIKIIKGILRYTKIYKTMRELDNNITILTTVKNIADNVIESGKKIDYIISFPYGGITLGFAYKSYLKYGLKCEKVPNILNSHFSSKQKLREKSSVKDKDFSIFKYIPRLYNNYVEDIKSGNVSILLLDNNVTTCKTLDLCKNFLTQIGNTVYSAVSAVNYDNIVNYLKGRDAEIMIPNWRISLDFNPVEEYITAFNTWNTSRKSERLQEIYYQQDNIETISFTKNIKQNNDFIFKVCRVQNIQDLNTIAINGANMIGLHAVYPDRIKYLKNELKYNPIDLSMEVPKNLPVDVLGLKGIRDMQKYIPDSIKQAVLFERQISIADMNKSLDLYNVKANKAYVQLHYRVDKSDIFKIKEYVTNKIITTIGLFQKDFKEYFMYLQENLNPKTDYILVDLSKHQPDLISFSENYKESIDRVAVLNHVAKCMKGNKVPIIIADDTTTEQMNAYLEILEKNNVYVRGIDMQNTLEYSSIEQKYQMVKCGDEVYQIKIRKSGTKLANWSEFLDNLNIEVFNKNI